jgi:hypothetical protein
VSLHYPPRRNFGRRKRDRFAAAVGIGLGFCLTGLLLTTNQCDKGTVSGPTTAEATSAPVAAAPAPAPTATPTVIDDDPAKALDLACFAGAQMVATYNGQASFAEIETWDTDFDNQNPQPRPNLRTDLVAKGKTVTRTFTVCRQGDAAIKGGKESGCFWDKRGNPFTPHTPAGTKATEECRQCDSKTARWIELEERKVGEWEDYIPETYPDATEQKCFKSQRQLVIVFEQNECSKEKRELRRYYESKQVETQCPCEVLHPPSWGQFSIDADDSGSNQSIKASIQVNNAGTWKLELYAGNSTNDYPNSPDFTKPAVTKTLKCGESFTLVNEYDWRFHESDEWWFKLYLNGVLKATSARIHKN